MKDILSISYMALQLKRKRPVFRFVDLGFGSEADHLRTFATPNLRAKQKPKSRRQLIGVEQPSAPRIAIPGVTLTYKGFHHWIKHVKPNSISLINGDFFFHNLFAEMRASQRVKALRQIRDSLRPGGFLTATVPKAISPWFEERLKEAGFTSVRSRVLQPEEATTPFRKHYLTLQQEDPSATPILVVGRKKR